MPKIRTADINDNAVTNAKLATVPANTLKGNNTSSTANQADLTKEDVIEMLEIRGLVYAVSKIGLTQY